MSVRVRYLNVDEVPVSVSISFHIEERKAKFGKLHNSSKAVKIMKLLATPEAVDNTYSRSRRCWHLTVRFPQSLNGLLSSASSGKRELSWKPTTSINLYSNKVLGSGGGLWRYPCFSINLRRAGYSITRSNGRLQLASLFLDRRDFKSNPRKMQSQLGVFLTL